MACEDWPVGSGTATPASTYQLVAGQKVNGYVRKEKDTILAPGYTVGKGFEFAMLKWEIDVLDQVSL